MSTTIKSKKKLKLVSKKNSSIDSEEDSIDSQKSIVDDTSIENIQTVNINNNDLRSFEERERKTLKDNKYPYLYPNLNDPEFNIKIAEKKEFSDNKYDGTINNIEEHYNNLNSL